MMQYCEFAFEIFGLEIFIIYHSVLFYQGLAAHHHSWLISSCELRRYYLFDDFLIVYPLFWQVCC